MRRQPLPEPLRLAYLQAMGLGVWQWRRPASEPAPQAVASADATAAPDPAVEPAEPGGATAVETTPPIERPDDRPVPASAEDWNALREEVAACRACDLYRTRTQTVFGVGDTAADLLIIGEAPGADEDRQGEPFVGRAGQLLNAMLAAIGLQREHVYIANILKCRPPGNRDPKADEVNACQGFLRRQVAAIRPRLILAVGRVSAQALLESGEPIGRLRGRLHRYGDTPVLATYHPAYLLRSPGQKRKAWDDLKQVRRILER